LRVIANPADAVSLERMVGTPPRGIGAKSFEAITELAASQNIPAFEAMGRLETYSKVALRIAKQAGMLYSWMHDLRSRAGEMSVRGIVEEVVAHSGFEPYLDTLDDASMRKQNLAEMLSAASAFDAEKSSGGLHEFLERVALVSDSEQIDSRGGRAALMTLHTSKGLEYPIVFIAGMEEGLFPHSRSADIDEEVEEERRLCYVGMSRPRAKRRRYARCRRARPTSITPTASCPTTSRAPARTAWGLARGLFIRPLAAGSCGGARGAATAPRRG